MLPLRVLQPRKHRVAQRSCRAAALLVALAVLGCRSRSGPPLAQLIVDGESRPLVAADLARVPHVPGAPGGGRDARDGVPLRELLGKLVGPGAQLLEVRGAGGAREVVEPSRWLGTEETPVVRINRRGELRFEWWLRGQPLEGGVRGVTELRVRR